MTEHNGFDNRNGGEHGGEHGEKSQEERINALLDGDLDPIEAERLKAMAAQDEDLMRAIVEAYQLQRAMEQLRVEKAPASLRRRLKQIPRQNRPVYLQPRWAVAFAIVPLVIIAVALMRSQEPPVAQVDQAHFDQVRVDQARQDLAVAFAYIDKLSDRTSNLIESEVGGELSQAVAGSIFKTVQHRKLL